MDDFSREGEIHPPRVLLGSRTLIVWRDERAVGGKRRGGACSTTYGPIAQLWLERAPDKGKVGGSTPPGPTRDDRGRSSIGRASPLHGEGYRFDPGRLHQRL